MRHQQAIVAGLGMLFRTLLLAAAFLLGREVYWSWPEWEGRANVFLTRHNLTIELNATKALVVGAAVYGAANFALWLILRGQQDQSDIGRTLKRLKLGQAVMGEGIALLFSASLLAYYEIHRFDPLQEFALIVFIVGGMLVASAFCVWLGVLLWRDNRSL